MRYRFSISFILCLVICLAPDIKAQSRAFHPVNPYVVDTASPREIPGMNLVWHDEFNREGMPDPGNWGFEYGFVRNRELQWYQPQNAWCRDGRLIIEGKKEQVDNPNFNLHSGDWRMNQPHAGYSSSCLITRGLHEWLSYGYVEVRARIDTVSGSWPAIWLLGSEGQWPGCGEIDMMEFYRINKVPTILANVAWNSENPFVAKWDDCKKPLADFLNADPDWTDKYHTWSMHWDEGAIQLYLDDMLMNEIFLSKTINPDGTNPFSEHKKHYLLLNLAIGSNGGVPSDEMFPITFEVDYVRVYRPE
jgi:beta-glucanase (GH16 family)